MQDINTTPKKTKIERGPTTQLYFWFFRCRVDVLHSQFSRSTISFTEFSVSARCIFLLLSSFIDPKFCGIFVFGPLQFKCQFITWDM